MRIPLSHAHFMIAPVPPGSFSQPEIEVEADRQGDETLGVRARLVAHLDVHRHRVALAQLQFELDENTRVPDQNGEVFGLDPKF